jgi:hypothetical protein
MSWGLRRPSPSASTPSTDHVDGMNSIGPTAQSNRASPSSSPASVSRIHGVEKRPSGRTPTMPGVATPSSSRELPPMRPWSDSTRPIAAISSHRRWQEASAALLSVSARR